MKKIFTVTLCLVLTVTNTWSQHTYTQPAAPFSTMFDGELIEADYWDTVPRILSAGLGFSNIVAVDTNPLDQNVSLLAGGNWLTDISCGSNPGDFTTVSLRNQVENAYIFQNEPWLLRDGAIGLDGLPILFSWPVLSHTIDVTDFRFILNTGDTVKAYMAGTWPNIENNERNCVVVYGEFSNRKPSSDPATRFPVEVLIVDDGSPLLLAGPNDQIASAVGLSWQNTGNPYDPNNGPRLVGAKLNHVGTQIRGEGTTNPLLNNFVGYMPNDEFALYGGGDFRLRMLTSGGFSPDGVRGVRPDDFERFFRLHALAPDSSIILLEKTDTVYTLLGGTLKILGLSDLGQASSSYDDCYAEDGDNYIDIILEGDEAAARNISFLEMPSLAGGYDAMYNPGGPGTTPFPTVVYTSPGPADLEPVIMALDDPWRVSADSTATLHTTEHFEKTTAFSIYPNPVANALRFSPDPNFEGLYEIRDLRGSLMMQTYQSRINVAALAPGIYLALKKQTDGRIGTAKFQKLP